MRPLQESARRCPRGARPTSAPCAPLPAGPPWMDAPPSVGGAPDVGVTAGGIIGGPRRRRPPPPSGGPRPSRRGGARAARLPLPPPRPRSARENNFSASAVGSSVGQGVGGRRGAVAPGARRGDPLGRRRRGDPAEDSSAPGVPRAEHGVSRRGVPLRDASRLGHDVRRVDHERDGAPRSHSAWTCMSSGRVGVTLCTSSFLVDGP